MTAKELSHEEMAEAFGVEPGFIKSLEKGGVRKKDKESKKKRKSSGKEKPLTPTAQPILLAYDTERVVFTAHAIKRLRERSENRRKTVTYERWARELLAQSQEIKLTSTPMAQVDRLLKYKPSLPVRYFVISKYRFIIQEDDGVYVVITTLPRDKGIEKDLHD